MTARRIRAAMLTGALAAAVASVVTAPAFPAGAARTGKGSEPTYVETVDAAIDDLEDYWADTFPDIYGARYQPVPPSHVIAGRPGVKLPSCQGEKLSYRDVSGNAFYCYGDNFIAYDDAKLFRNLHADIGPFAVALVLAHEWGHAVQDRAGESRGVATIYQELQADCFAGAWTEDVATTKSAVAFEPGDLEVSIVALLQFRDAPGSSPDDQAAHGSAFDRVSAFQDGFEFGPQRCADYFVEPPVVVQIPFADEQDAARQGNVPAEDVIPLTVDLLNDFYSQVEPAYKPLTVDDVGAFDSAKPRTIPKCGRSRLTVAEVKNRLFYCLDDSYVAFDEPFLQSIYDDIGDFGVSTLLANPWATYVQTIQGVPGVATNELATVLQADCYTGGWAAAFYLGYLTGGSLSAGDLDEFVQAFLVYSRARGVSAAVPITFVRVRFFRRGFLSGYESCAYADIAAEAKRL